MQNKKQKNKIYLICIIQLINKHFNHTIAACRAHQHINTLMVFFILRRILHLLAFLAPIRLELLIELAQNIVRLGRKQRARNDRIMRLYPLPVIISIASTRVEHRKLIVRLPNVRALVLRPANHILVVGAQRRFDVHSRVREAFVFADQRQISQVV